MKKILVFILLTVVAGGAAFFLTRPQKMIPREELFGLPARISPQISPDGRFVSFIAPLNGVLNIWVQQRVAPAFAPLRGMRRLRVGGAQQGGVPRPLTHDKGRGIHYYGWLPDGEHILFLQDEGGNENWHLYRIPVEGGEAKDLTPFKDVQARVLEINKHFPDSILIELNKDDPKYHDAYRLHLASGTVQLVAKNDGTVAGWIVDPGMRIRGKVVSRSDGGRDVFIRSTEGSEWKKVLSWNFEDDMGCSVVGFSKDGRKLFFIDGRENDTNRLVSFDIASGSSTLLFSDPEFDVGAVVQDPDTYKIEMVGIYRDRGEWIAMDPAVAEDLAVIRRIQPGDLGIVSRSYDKRYWMVAFDNDISPLKYYIYDKKTKKSEFFFTHRPALLKYRLCPVVPVTIPARDGLKMRGYLTLPRYGKKPFSMVLLVHGGPWTRDGWGYDPTVQWLADRGYACLQVNYRGSTGFGKAFVNAGNREWGRKMQADLTDAVHWAIRKGVADPGRVGIMGGSYGGYAVLAAAAFTPDVFQCGVDLFGPSDLATLIRSMPPYWSVEKVNILKRLGDPDTEPDFLKEISPLNYADRIRMPLLIAQGANDPRVKPEESDRIVKALREKGIECEYMVFPDEGHGFVKPENRLAFYKAVEAFLAKHLGGRYQA